MGKVGPKQERSIISEKNWLLTAEMERWIYGAETAVEKQEAQ